MKKHLIILLGVTMTFYGCPSEVEEDPTCTDGEMNGTETGIDCGGDCIPCFDCTSSFCSSLSGGTSSGPKTSKIWVCTYVDDIPIDSSESAWIFSPLELTYSSSGRYKENDVVHQVSLNAFWSFDDPNDPTSINYVYEDGTEKSETFVSITEDEFIFMIGNEVTTWEPK